MSSATGAGDPEVAAIFDAPVAEPVAIVVPAHTEGMNVALTILAAIALVAALYLARGFFVPLLIGILASYALHPVVDWLELGHVPRAVGAALVLAMVVGSFTWIGVSMSDDATAVIEQLPEAARKLRQNLSVARSGAPTALQNMQEVANELQGAAADAGAPAADAGLKPGAPAQPAVRTVTAPAPEPTWLRDYTLAQYGLLASVIAQTPIVLLLTYFLLASGQHFRRKLVRLVGPSLSRKKDAVHILEEIDVQVQRFLLAMLVSNTLLAAVTWFAFLTLGLEHAGVWGVAAGIFHFVPYLGPALIAIASGVAAFMQSGSPFYALTVGGISLLIAGMVGYTFMTWLQSRFASLNAAVLFIGLLFFGWLWGVWGLLLGAPLVAIAKAVFDRIESLKPVGDLLGH